MSPVFAHGQLRLYLLKLLAEAPKHGYEVIQALSDRFGGSYSPSAGTVYPRLTKLEEEGLVTRSSDGRKTVYAITAAGEAELAARADDLANLEQEVTASVRSLADQVRRGVDDAMKSLKAELAAAAREAAEPVTAAPPRPDRESHVASRLALQDAEVHLSSFRSEVRVSLRAAVQEGRLTAEAVREFEQGLDAVRRTLHSRLHD